LPRLVIDTDPGVDDAHALMLSHAHPNAQVEAIMTVGGNVGIQQTTTNACAVLDMLGADTPVYPGCSGPLVLQPEEDAAIVHGADGLGDCGLSRSNRLTQAEHASVALVRLANENPGDLTLVAIAPLTNIAVALKLDPELPKKIKRFVVMGGAVRSEGNTHNITAEFNIYTDPEAAHIVFECWPGLELVSWETTLNHPIPTEDVTRWYSDIDSPRMAFFKAITEKTFEYQRAVFGERILYAPDGLAVACAIDPTLITESDNYHVSIEIYGRYTRGQTSVDWMHRHKHPPNVRIITGIDQVRFAALMEQAVH